MTKTIVNSWNDFDPLRHVIVGRADFTCIPPTEPATEAKIPEDSDMRGMWGPRPLDTVEKANQQLDGLASLLDASQNSSGPPDAHTMESGGNHARFHQSVDVRLHAPSRCSVDGWQGNPLGSDVLSLSLLGVPRLSPVDAALL